MTCARKSAALANRPAAAAIQSAPQSWTPPRRMARRQTMTPRRTRALHGADVVAVAGAATVGGRQGPRTPPWMLATKGANPSPDSAGRMRGRRFAQSSNGFLPGRDWPGDWTVKDDCKCKSPAGTGGAVV